MRVQTADATPVWVRGEGPTVVLVHGVLMDHRMWDAQVEALAARYRVCCIDMLGHGECADRPGERSLDEFVAQVDGVLGQFCENGPPTLGGFSMGGLIAQAYAARYHRKLAALMILNAVYDRSPEEARTVRGRFEAMRDGGVESAVDSAQARWFTDADRRDRPALVEDILQWMRDGPFAPKLKAHRVFSSSDGQVTGRLSQVSCPALVMTGEHDGGSTPRMARDMAAAIPDAELHVLDGQRHMMPVLDAARVNGVLLDFLDRRVLAARP